MTLELNRLNRNSRAHMYNINNFYLCCLIVISNDCYKSNATSIPIISSVDWCVTWQSSTIIMVIYVGLHRSYINLFCSNVCKITESLVQL